MQRRRLLSLSLPLVMLAACSERESPTAPVEPGGMAEAHTAGHKVVNSLADPGNGVCNATQCTLREAIDDPQSTRISFAPGLTGEITLARSELGGGTLVMGKTLRVTGPVAGITVRRRATDPPFRLLRVARGAVVTLSNLTLRGGDTDQPGGGIINWGTLALANCTVAGNASGSHGGGIENHGPLTLTDTRVVDNTAAERGGGIFNQDAALTLRNSIVSRNTGQRGGGIYHFSGTLRISNSGVSDNQGNGIVQARGSSTLDRVRILGNSTSGGGGGIVVGMAAAMTLTNSTVAGNSAASGGGILIHFGNLTIGRSTVFNNAATGPGGGIYNASFDPFARLGSSLVLTNSTISGNSAATGGGIQNSGLSGAFTTVTNSTIAFNSARDAGGGIRADGGGRDEISNGVRLTNSLVALNDAPVGPDLSSIQSEFDQVSAASSLIGNGSASGITDTDGNQVGSAGAPIDPLLAPLANYGGPTATHRLLPGSPAIDAASAADCRATDQRGVTRPQGPGCDIGSFERSVP